MLRQSAVTNVTSTPEALDRRLGNSRTPIGAADRDRDVLIADLQVATAAAEREPLRPNDGECRDLKRALSVTLIEGFTASRNDLAALICMFVQWRTKRRRRS